MHFKERCDIFLIVSVLATAFYYCFSFFFFASYRYGEINKPREMDGNVSSDKKEKVCPSCKSIGTFELTRNGVIDLQLCVECGFLDADGSGLVKLSCECSDDIRSKGSF